MNNARVARRLDVYATAAMIAAGSILLLIVVLRLRTEYLSETRWQATRGVILRVESARIEYEYAANGVTRSSGSLFASSGEFQDFRDALASSQAFAPGQAVVVFYDPARPDRACLFPGATFGSVLMLLLSIGLLASGAWSRVLRRAGNWPAASSDGAIGSEGGPARGQHQ